MNINENSIMEPMAAIVSALPIGTPLTPASCQRKETSTLNSNGNSSVRMGTGICSK
jgi:hypothetical protein